MKQKSEYRPGGQIEGFQPVKSTRVEIKDKDQIQKKIDRAKAIFVLFLGRRNSQTASFEITFDNMLLNLDLFDIPRDVALKAMDQIVTSVPGFVKTEKGYAVSDPELLVKNFGPKEQRVKVLQFFTDHPDIEFTSRQIGEKIGFSASSVNAVIKELISAGQVCLVKTESIMSNKMGKRAGIYKLVIKK